MKKSILVGLGNDIISDDRIGLDLARDIQNAIDFIYLAESQAIHMGLLTEIAGFEKLIVVDSIKTGKNPPGTLSRLGLAEVENRMGNYSTHQVSLYDLINVGKAMGFVMPSDIVIYAVEVLDNLTISERLTEPLEGHYPDILRQIITNIQTDK